MLFPDYNIFKFKPQQKGQAKTGMNDNLVAVIIVYAETTTKIANCPLLFVPLDSTLLVFETLFLINLLSFCIHSIY